ncbi:hypothetical protein D3C78_1777870 [compost metagenome]
MISMAAIAIREKLICSIGVKIDSILKLRFFNEDQGSMLLFNKIITLSLAITAIKLGAHHICILILVIYH